MVTRRARRPLRRAVGTQLVPTTQKGGSDEISGAIRPRRGSSYSWPRVGRSMKCPESPSRRCPRRLPSRTCRRATIFSKDKTSLPASATSAWPCRETATSWSTGDRETSNPIWDSDTDHPPAGYEAAFAKLQSDGNFVVSSFGGQFLVVDPHPGLTQHAAADAERREPGALLRIALGLVHAHSATAGCLELRRSSEVGGDEGGRESRFSRLRISPEFAPQEVHRLCQLVRR